MKTRREITLFLLFYFLAVFLFFPLNVIYGDEIGGAGWGDEEQVEEEGGAFTNPLKADSFADLVNNIAQWIFNIALSVATVMFLIGGFQFLVSGGDENKVTQAKKTMLWSAVGLAICLIGSGFTALIRQLLEK